MFLGWSNGHPLYWIVAFIFSAVNIFESYNLQYVVNIVDILGNLTTEVSSVAFPILSYINIFLAALCLVLFFWDIFNPKQDLKREE